MTLGVELVKQLGQWQYSTMTTLSACILIWPAYVAEISKIYKCYINIRNFTQNLNFLQMYLHVTVLMACVIFKGTQD